MDINVIASEIARNNAGEQQAIADYFRLISDTRGLPQKFVDDIHEIISDEMNHSAKLAHWVNQLTGVLPAKD
ncbi:MAG: hypothetical protein LBG88_02910 [Christensenellaceae bacterium]|jgi:rubrerythrin|nr:hypothetical protein [Christensenellaceae bacterium]